MLRRIGGRCSTHNMKVVFKVCCNETERNHITDHGPGETRDTGGDAEEIPRRHERRRQGETREETPGRDERG